MDVNDTRLHALYGARDWQQAIANPDSVGVRWNTEQQDVSLMPELFLFPTPASEQSLTAADRRGAAADCYGNVYWIAPDAQGICVRPNHHGSGGPYWSLEDFGKGCAEPEGAAFAPVAEELPRPTRLSGLAVTEDQYLVIGTLEPAGLIVFDLHAGAPEVSWLNWPAAFDFAPFDIAQADGGGVWILDRTLDPGGRPAVLWLLDRYLRIVGPADSPAPSPPPAFLPHDGLPPPDMVAGVPAPIPLESASPPGVIDAMGVLALPDGSVLVLDTPADAETSTLRRYRDGHPAGSAALRDLLGVQEITVRGHDFAYVDDGSSEVGILRGRLFIADEKGNQSYVYTLIATGDELTVALNERYLPMRRFGGRALVLKGESVCYDLDTNAAAGCATTEWLPLVEKRRQRFANRGKIGGIVLDGKKPGCVWHRVLFDACAPETTALRIRSRAADSLDALAFADWRDEPSPYLRGGGSEIPLHKPFADHARPRAGSGTWELLFQSASGRFVELCVELSGNGRSSPRIRTMRVYYPRFSYLREYLPAVYGDDADSASFLDRYLANPEGILSLLEGRIEKAQALIDTRTAPPDYLEWLAGWLGAVLEPDWSDARRRLFLDHAPLLFGWRGTPIGIRAAVRIATELCPDPSIFDELKQGAEDPGAAFGINAVRVVEGFSQRSLPGVAVGDPTEITGPQPVEENEPWRPELGSAPLHAAYQDFLLDTYSGSGGEAEALGALAEAWSITPPATLTELLFPPLVPDNEVAAADWLRFTRLAIGFTYAGARADDRTRYQEFLVRSYHAVAELNKAHGLTGAQVHTAFADVPLPDKLPDGSAELNDWIAFVSQILPIERSAHRFSVLVPTEPDEDTASREHRLGQVATIVAREKPANTDFDVRLYWALFRVGAARLGWDTALGEGSRFVAMVLGRGYLASSYVEPTEPWNLTDRTVLGRDRQSNV